MMILFRIIRRNGMLSHDADDGGYAIMRRDSRLINTLAPGIASG